MAKILTIRKQKWVESRKPKLIEGTVITPPAAVANRYYSDLSRLIDEMTADTHKQVMKLFKSEVAEEYFAMDESISERARILSNSLLQKFLKRFAEMSDPLADRFVKNINNASSSQVYSSIQQLSGGLSLSTKNLDGQLKDMLQATISENVQLIKTIPQRYLTQVQGAVMRSITTGNGLHDLVPFLASQKDISHRQSQLMALDQTRKAMNNLSKGRMQNVGITEYMWVHTGGSAEPRPLHKNVLNGKVFSFDDPPVIDEKTGDTGIPGQAINCRCRMKPVISFKENV